MSTPSNHHHHHQRLNPESISTIGNIVLKPSRAIVLESYGDGFGSYIERLINVAHESHRSFSNLINTLNDFINYIRQELEKSFSKYQFTIIAGKNFDYYENFSTNHFALIEHTGMKILIFSSIGTSYKLTTTITNEIDDDKNPLIW